MVNFDCSRVEMRLISKIAQRAVSWGKQCVINVDRHQIEMDITACHCNGCQLDLEKLLNAPNGDFGHDVFGIRRHIDRETGKLTGFFDPRCSMPAVEAIEGD